MTNYAKEELMDEMERNWRLYGIDSKDYLYPEYRTMLRESLKCGSFTDDEILEIIKDDLDS